MGQTTDIDLPPGMLLTDSPLVAAGRWIDGDNVRFYNDRPQKMGGNMVLSPSPMSGPPRGVCAWNDLSARLLIAAGNFQHLYVAFNSNYLPIDITPSDFVPGTQEPTAGFGYGADVYGTGTYGTTRTKSSAQIDPMYWSVQNFGQLLLAAPADQKLYVWNPGTVPFVAAAAVTSTFTKQPPAQMRGFWVTEERFVIAFGCSGPNNEGQSLMRLYWCAQGDYTDWTTTHTPTEVANLLGAPAGSRQLQAGTRIVNGADIGAYVSLVWTDAAVYTLTYTGDQYTFNSQLVGRKCGLLARFAFAIAGPTVYWVSNNAFWMYQGGSLAQIPNQDDVRAYFFAALRDSNYSSKMFAYFDEAFNEIHFCAVPTGSLEPTLSVVYMINNQRWFKTTIPPRSAHVAFQNLNDSPILFGADGNIYQHESGLDNNGAPADARILTGLFEVADGDQNLSSLGVFPDMERQTGDMTMTLTALDRDRGTFIETQAQTFGPEDLSVDYRVGGREVQIEFSSNVLGGDFRLGKCKLEVATTGRRR